MAPKSEDGPKARDGSRRLFDENGHVDASLSAREQFDALIDAGRTDEALRIVADAALGAPKKATKSTD